ncbi:MAG TPA: hypothetical protein VE956_03055 [Nodularia sp. (in: cyanobacteria)]|nr:hypothetical protein [Nodularia sp. (in: cyanobacteria)]
MSLLLCPDAIKPTIVPTVIRIPLMQGLPPMTSGFRVILVRFCMELTSQEQVYLIRNLKTAVSIFFIIELSLPSMLLNSQF